MRAFILIAVFSFVSHSTYATKVYKWIDEQGVTHFTQTPPQNYQTKKIVIPKANIDAEAAKRRLQKQIESLKSRQEEHKLKREKGEKAVKYKNEMASYCQGIKSSLDVLAKNKLVKAKGSDKVISNEEKKKTLANLQAKYKANCL